VAELLGLRHELPHHWDDVGQPPSDLHGHSRHHVRIAFLPYPTAVFAQHFDKTDRFAATMLYAGTMALIAIFFSVLWAYAGSHGLMAQNAATSRVVRRRGQLIYRLAPLIYLAGGLASLVDPRISLAVFIALAIYWISSAAGRT
jgi:uncharacterized membrane protein